MYVFKYLYQYGCKDIYIILQIIYNPILLFTYFAAQIVPDLANGSSFKLALVPFWQNSFWKILSCLLFQA